MYNKLKTTTYKILKRSEKWTKTDMIYLAKGGSWMTLGKLVGSITGIVLAVIYANYLSKEDYAIYKYILSMASIFFIVTLPGLETSLTRSIAKGYEATLFQVIKERLKWSIIGSVLSLSIGVYYFVQDNNTLAIGFFLIAITAPFINSINISPYIQGKKMWRYSAKINVIRNIATFIIIASVAIIFPDAIAIITAFFISGLLLQIYFYKKTIQKYKPNDKQDSECIPLGKHLSLMSVLGLVADQIDKILIWKFLGATELAIYSFALIPVQQIQNFLKTTTVLAFPKMAEQKREIIKRTLLLKVFKFMAILVIPTIIYTALSPLFFKILFPQYLDSIFYSQLFAIVIVFFPQRIISQSLLVLKKTKYLYFYQISYPFFKIALLLILIPLFHINGAILTLIISQIISIITLIILFKKI